MIERGRHVLVSGTTQTGKSTWVVGALSSCPLDVLAYDPDDEYAPGSSHRELAAALRALEAARKHGTRGVAVVASDTFNRERMAREVSILARYAFARGDLVLVVDEAGESARRHVMPEELYRVARRGAKRGISLVVVSQRLCDVDTDLRSQCTRHVYFRHDELADIKAIHARWGPEVADHVQALPNFQHVTLPDDLDTIRAGMARCVTSGEESDHEAAVRRPPGVPGVQRGGAGRPLGRQAGPPRPGQGDDPDLVDPEGSSTGEPRGSP